MSDYDFALPSLGADMEGATILEWRIGVGDDVQRGDIVAVIDTEKSEIDLEIWHGGTVTELLVAEGDEVPVGTVLARLTEVTTTGAGSPVDPATTTAPSRTSDSTTPLPARNPRPQSAGPPVHSPLVRHLAESARLDLRTVAGTGPGGRITRADVEAAARMPPVGSTPGRTPPAGTIPASPLARRLAIDRGIELSTVHGSGPGGAVLAADVPRPQEPRSRGDAMRQAVATLMTRSKREIPHYYLAQDIDVARALTWMRTTNEDRRPDERLLPAILLIAATARAAATHSELNGFWVNGRFEPADSVHIGVAVAIRGGGLIAPALLDAAERPLEELMSDLRDLVGRARGGRLRSAEMSSATLTVTSLGDRGPDMVQGIIHPPQVALVGFGRVRERPAAVDGELTIRPTVTATLAGDHRATDGDRGARMLATIDRLLQEPERL